MQKPTNTDKARAAWGETLPGWVQELACACDESGLRIMAKRLDVSPATISLAINKQRGNKFDFVRVRVDAVLQTGMVVCPVRGLRTRQECREEQARPFVTTNKFRVQQAAACAGCKYKRG